MGIIAASQKSKKRKASIDVNTPVTASSTRRMSSIKAFVLSILQEARTHKGMINVVRKTSGKLMPSTPTAYSKKPSGNGTRSTNCIPPAL
jgi:hypothetical protein